MKSNVKPYNLAIKPSFVPFNQFIGLNTIYEINIKIKADINSIANLIPFK